MAIYEQKYQIEFVRLNTKKNSPTQVLQNKAFGLLLKWSC